MKDNELFSQLLYSLQPYPAMRFLLFCSEWGERERTLARFCLEGEHELQVYGVDMDMQSIDDAKIRKRVFRASQERYNLQGRLYDYVFVNAVMDEMETFLERIYTAMMNAGRIYIDSKNCEEKNCETLGQIIEKCNYLSVNLIALSEETAYLSARKMHGWGD